MIHDPVIRTALAVICLMIAFGGLALVYAAFVGAIGCDDDRPGID